MPTDLGLVLLANIKRLAVDKHTSLLRTFVNYRRKSFITLVSGVVGAKISSHQYSNGNKLECFSPFSIVCQCCRLQLRVGATQYTERGSTLPKMPTWLKILFSDKRSSLL